MIRAADGRRRWSRRRVVLSVLIALVVSVLVAGGLWVRSALGVRSALEAARADAEEVRTSLGYGDQPGAEAAARRFQAHAGDASRAVDGPTWSLMSAVPLIGDDVRAVRILARGAGRIADDAVTPALRLSSTADRLLPRLGRIDLEAVAGLQPEVTSAATAIADVRADLATVNRLGLLAPLRRAVDEVTTALDEVDPTVQAVRAGVRLLPTAFGQEGPRRYLMVVQNPAEARATGGLGGSVALVEARAGRLRIVRQVAGNMFISPRPVVRPRPEETAVFGPTTTSDFRDANLTPDLPRAAEVWSALWRQRFPGRIDGVLTVDPEVLGGLLGVTGPLTVQGVRLDSGNTARFLAVDAYRRFLEPARQDVFFQGVARAVFGRVTGTGALDPRRLLKVLRAGVDDRRILLHLTAPSEQLEIAGSRIAGELTPSRSGPPLVGLYRNDASSSKLAAYLTSRTRLSGRCERGRQRLSLDTTLRSDLSPAEARRVPDYPAGSFERRGLARGTYVLSVVAVGPIGGTIDALRIDGAVVTGLRVQELDGRPVAVSYLTMAPGRRLDLRWSMTAPAGRTEAPLLDVSPGVGATDAETRATGCRRAG